MNLSKYLDSQLAQLKKMTPVNVSRLETDIEPVEKNESKSVCKRCGLELDKEFHVCPRCRTCVVCEMISFNRQNCSACKNGLV
jgi:lipopolysaccharide biosynthesis regulator YciM